MEILLHFQLKMIIVSRYFPSQEKLKINHMTITLQLIYPIFHIYTYFNVLNF